MLPGRNLDHALILTLYAGSLPPPPLNADDAPVLPTRLFGVATEPIEDEPDDTTLLKF